MIQKTIFILFMLFPINALSYENYKQSNPQWKTNRQINNDFVIHSIMRLDETEIIEIMDKYDIALRLFSRENGHPTCKPQMVYVYLLGSRKDLSNRDYFPNEPDYDTTKEIIRGRYYKNTNAIYVPPFYEFRWGFYFAHELLHHFVVECNIKFENMDKEHEMIDKFLYKYDNRF